MEPYGALWQVPRDKIRQRREGQDMWVSDEVRKLAAPDQYGRTMPFAVYVRY